MFLHVVAYTVFSAQNPITRISEKAFLPPKGYYLEVPGKWGAYNSRLNSKWKTPYW